MKKLILFTAMIVMTGIALGQGVQKGNLVGVHVMTVTLTPGVTMEQFLDFYQNKYIPAYEKNLPGIKMYVAKGIRGENENSFGLIYIITSKEVRDKYWTETDVTTELAQSAFKKLEPLSEEGKKLGAWTRTKYTDWVIQ